MFETIDGMGEGKRVLSRIDLNSPVENGEVRENRRFSRHAETVKRLVEENHSVTLMAHQGRPGDDSHIPLEQHADILSKHVDHPVEYVRDVHGREALKAIGNNGKREVLLLENVRFSEHEMAELSPEQHARNGFVRKLKDEFDCYVNDAYSAAHRSHASLVGFPHVMESYAGPVMESEYENNTRIHDIMEGDVTMLLGGKKVGDVVHVMDSLKGRVDNFLLGGLVGELFLRARGYDVGYDVEDDEFMHRTWIDNRSAINNLMEDSGGKILLPEDLAYHNDDRMREEVVVEEAAKTRPYWDVGKRTVDLFGSVIEESDAVFVKGAPGVFEDEKFSFGTVKLLEAIGSSKAFSVVGGGDTSRAIDIYGLDEDRYGHVSIAGGAYIRSLTGEELPAVEALKG